MRSLRDRISHSFPIILAHSNHLVLLDMGKPCRVQGLCSLLLLLDTTPSKRAEVTRMLSPLHLLFHDTVALTQGRLVELLS